LQPHLLSRDYMTSQLCCDSRSRAMTSYKRRHHGDASSALQRIPVHHIYVNGQPISRRQLVTYVAGRAGLEPFRSTVP